MNKNTEAGIYGIVQSIYNVTIREHLPRKVVKCNGIDAPRARLLDASGDAPDYEAPLIEAVRRIVSDGDRVVVVGAGFGVSAVAAANQGAEQVTAFEVGREQASVARRTARMNDATPTVRVRHAAVGPVINPYSDPDVAEHVDPSALPPGDVLICDVEGAERKVLPAMPAYDSVIVESHGQFGSPTDEVRSTLQDRGYRIVSSEPEREDFDCVVLTASLDNDLAETENHEQD
jgi:predicted RNA methylase